MKIGISTKLTIWYSVVFFAALALYAFLIYFFISRQYYGQQQSLLKETAEEVLQFVREEEASLNMSQLEQEMDVQNLNRYGLFFEIYDQDKKVLYKTTNFPNFISPPEVLTESDQQIIAKDIYNSTFQLFISPIRHLSANTNGSPYYVLVGQSTLYVTAVLSRIRELLIVFGLGMLAVAAIGGWYMARRVLKPVATITNTARKLTAFHLDKRLPESGNNDELSHLVRTFNEMLDRIQAGVMRISQFSSDASHELRTPLTVMHGEIEIALRKERPPEEYKRVLQSLFEEVQRMEKIVSDLLFCARADSGHTNIENVPINLSEMLHENLIKMQPQAEAKQINMTFQAIEEPIQYQMDPGLFSQLIFNIIDNAIKYTDQGGKISARIKKGQESIRIEIEDTGTGIPKDELSKVFDRFYRIDKSRTDSGQSSGLGLSICKWIIEAYKGDIKLESEEGKGTIAIITLPLSEN